MVLTMKIQDLQQKNDILLTVNQMVTTQRNKEIKFLTRSIESCLCDYSDAYILVTGNITVTKAIAAAGNNPVQRKQSVDEAA